MFECNRYGRKLKKLAKFKTSLIKEFNQASERAVKKGEDFTNDYEFARIGEEITHIQSLIDYEKTEYYINICDKLVIPIPKKKSGDIYYIYNFSDNDGRYIFTTIGFQQIIKLIREERKEKSERFGFYSAIISGFISLLIGVIGVIIALVSVLK